MKKYSFFVTLLFVITSCSVLKPEPEPYTNTTVGIYTPPTSVTAENIDESHTYMVEGYLPSSGNVVLVLIKGPIMKQVARLTWVNNDFAIGSIAEGYIFTSNFLKNESRMSEEDIAKSEYSDEQKEMLRRFKNKEKFELVSVIGKATGTVSLQGESIKIQMVNTKTGTPAKTKKPKTSWNDL
jgi:hypothetical protein